LRQERIEFYYDLGIREIFDQVFICRKKGLGQESMHVKVMSEKRGDRGGDRHIYLV